MANTLRILVLLVVTLFMTPCYAKSLGTQEIEFIIPGTDRLVVAEIYYPTEVENNKKLVDFGLWQRKAFTKNAPLAAQNQQYPLMVFSHGWHGDRFGNSWIAEALVEEGYIVAMIDHQHNNSYESSEEFIYTSMWQRPLDMTALLDFLVQNPKWSQVIDKNKIAAGGFSLGGLTSLWLSGITAEPESFKNVMENYYAHWHDWPESIRKRAAAVDWNKASKSYYDPRIKAVFSIAPDLGQGFEAQGLAQAKVPVLLIVGSKDHITPSTDNAAYYHENIKNSELLTIKNALHDTFMNSCSALGAKFSPSSCEDHGIREKAHKEAGNKIITFLKGHLQK